MSTSTLPFDSAVALDVAAPIAHGDDLGPVGPADRGRLGVVVARCRPELVAPLDEAARVVVPDGDLTALLDDDAAVRGGKHRAFAHGVLALREHRGRSLGSCGGRRRRRLAKLRPVLKFLQVEGAFGGGRWRGRGRRVHDRRRQIDQGLGRRGLRRGRRLLLGRRGLRRGRRLLLGRRRGRRLIGREGLLVWWRHRLDDGRRRSLVTCRRLGLFGGERRRRGLDRGRLRGRRWLNFGGRLRGRRWLNFGGRFHGRW
jgi:hypothetical protein